MKNVKVIIFYKTIFNKMNKITNENIIELFDKYYNIMENYIDINILMSNSINIILKNIDKINWINS